MSHIPRLYTPRLCLRPFTPADAARVQELAGDPRIAATTAAIPHPYPDGAAETWIQSHQPAAALGKKFEFAITLAGTRTPNRESDPTETGFVIGAIGIGDAGEFASFQIPEGDQEFATLGYWIGVPFWNKGFATEAARAILDFAFTRRHYPRVLAFHFDNNPASGRVLQKLGMTHQGTLPTAFNKNGQFHDLVQFAILESEWARRRKSTRVKQAFSRPTPGRRNLLSFQ